MKQSRLSKKLHLQSTRNLYVYEANCGMEKPELCAEQLCLRHVLQRSNHSDILSSGHKQSQFCRNPLSEHLLFNPNCPSVHHFPSVPPRNNCSSPPYSIFKCYQHLNHLRVRGDNLLSCLLLHLRTSILMGFEFRVKEGWEYNTGIPLESSLSKNAHSLRRNCSSGKAAP